MHVPDGFIPPSICLIGYALTGGVSWYCLRQINRSKNPHAQIPKASLLTAAFFAASLIHIPLPPSSIHLVLNGLMGVVLGYYAFPAILIGLFFQAVMFQHGGLSTLGINGMMMGIPALLAYHLFQLRHLGKKQIIWTKFFAFLAGAIAFGLSAAVFTFLILATIPAQIDATQETAAIYASWFGYSIQMVIEGFFTLMLVSFLQQVKPELLDL